MFADTRVAVFLDTPNFYHSVKAIQSGAKLDYKKLIDMLNDRETQYVRIFAHVLDTRDDSENDSAGLESFIDRLESLQIDVVLQKPRQRGHTSKTDCNVAIAVEAMSMATKVDAVILGSGDGDFVPLINKLNAMGVKTIVMAFDRSVSDELAEAAGEYIELGDDLFLTKKESVGAAK